MKKTDKCVIFPTYSPSDGIRDIGDISQLIDWVRSGEKEQLHMLNFTTDEIGHSYEWTAFCFTRPGVNSKDALSEVLKEDYGLREFEIE